MRLHAVFFAVCVAICIAPGQSGALSIDASALSSSATRQIMASFTHLQTLPRSTFELSGKTVKSSGRRALYDIGSSQTVRLSGPVMMESDARYFNDHNTTSAAIGFGIPRLSLSAGVRMDYGHGIERRTYGKAGAKVTMSLKSVSLAGMIEVLADGDGGRMDYKLKAKYQRSRYYVDTRFERVRGTEIQGLSIGVELF